MATPRKRLSPGFSIETVEEPSPIVEDSIEETPQFEPEAVEEAVHVSTPYVEMSITPTEDPGPRFVEEVKVSEEEHIAQPVLLKKPKRYPRNTPKFSARF